jgi:ElaB/YqjD/DUF883 family membrane-anchored ribosome-binding protein
MTQQRADYPLDYSKGPAERGQSAEGTMDRVKDAAAEAQEIAGKVADQACEYGEKAQEAARNFKPYVEKSMKERPMETLAVASVIGFLLGALWKK